MQKSILLHYLRIEIGHHLLVPFLPSSSSRYIVRKCIGIVQQFRKNSFPFLSEREAILVWQNMFCLCTACMYNDQQLPLHSAGTVIIQKNYAIDFREIVKTTSDDNHCNGTLLRMRCIFVDRRDRKLHEQTNMRARMNSLCDL